MISASRYLIVTRLNSYKEPETTAIGPFGSDAELLAFAQGLYFNRVLVPCSCSRINTPTDTMTVKSPNDLYPWMVGQIQEDQAQEGL